MILGIDQGTTGTTAILLSSSGNFLGNFTSAVPQHFPQPGWVEHDPEEIWKSVEKAVLGVLEKTQRSATDIQAIGITNQRETVSLFDSEKPLHRFIVWQDRRTADFCQKLQSKAALILRRSGLPVDPYFSASKIRWLIKTLKLSSKNKDLRFRTIDSFILNRLTGKDVTETTNASRTSLLNLKSAKWDEVLFDIFQIPRHFAPELIPSESLNLKTKNVGFLPAGIPVAACLGDQQAALFGQMGFEKGSGKITFGTGSFILLNTGETPVISKNALVSTIALQWSSGKRTYALEGSAFICGAWIQWLRDKLEILTNATESEILAEAVNNSGGLIVVPALSGMGAPFWKPNLRGGILGLTRGSSKAHLARASLEALAFQNRALIDAMKIDLPKLRTSWRVDGGAVRNDLLMQIQANVLENPIIRPMNLEATSTGVAMLAAFAVKALSLEDIKKLWKQDRIFDFDSKTKKDMRSGYARWSQAVEVLNELPTPV